MAINSSISVSAPYTLFPIPSPVTTATPQKQAPTRRIFTSEVTAPVHGKKRKRGPAELCAAVDNDGVNIYNVTGTQIVSSYPLPPQTTFHCAPLSVRFSTKDDGKHLRQSYACVSKPKTRIVGWTEAPRADDDETAPGIEITPYSRELVSQSPVHLLARIGHRKKAAEKGYVLALHEDTLMTAYNPTLSEELWHFSLRGSQDSTTAKRRTNFATVTKASIVQQSILAERPDVVLYQPGKESEDAQDDDVLFVITSGGVSGWELSLIQLPNTETVDSAARVLLTLPLAQASEFHPAKTQISVHLESGSLHMFSAGRILSFTLHSTLPKLLTKLDIPSLATTKAIPQLHFLQLSPSVVGIASNSGISFLDTKYSSIQARIFYKHLSEAERTEATTFIPTTWSKSANLLIGASRSGLSAVQISKSGKGTIFSKESSLIDSLGRGLENKTDTPLKTYPKIDADATFAKLREKYITDRLYALKPVLEFNAQQLEKFRRKDRTYFALGIKELQSAKAANNVADFEKAFASYCGLKVEHLAKESNGSELEQAAPEKLMHRLDIKVHRAEPEDMPEGLALKAKDRFQYPRIPHEFALEALKSIITPSESDGRLQISFYPEDTFRTLVLTRNVTTSTLRAIKLANGGTEVEFGEFVDCLVEYDPSLKLLAWVLQRMPEVEASDTVRAIRTVLQRIFDPEESSQPEAGDDEMMAVDEESPELQLQRETQRAEKALEDAQRALTESAMREVTLRIALARLNTFPHEIIVKNLKKGLDGDQLLTLVRMLRKELILDRDDVYEDPDDGLLPALQQDSADNAALICDILTCCLDAVGLTGLILANEPTHRLATLDDGTAESSGLLVESLLDEVQKSVSALENSVDLGLFLGELVRHSTANKHHTNTANPSKQTKKQKNQKQKQKQITAKLSEAPKDIAPEPDVSDQLQLEDAKKAASTPRAIVALHPKRKRPMSRKERLQRACRGRLGVADKRQRAVPEQVTAIRRMVAEMLPMFGAKRDTMSTNHPNRELAMGIVGGRTKYAVEKVDV